MKSNELEQDKLDRLFRVNEKIYNLMLQRLKEPSWLEKGLKKFTNATPLIVINFSFAVVNALGFFFHSKLVRLIRKLDKPDFKSFFNENKEKIIKEIAIYSIILIIGIWASITYIKTPKEEQAKEDEYLTETIEILDSTPDTNLETVFYSEKIKIGSARERV